MSDYKADRERLEKQLDDRQEAISVGDRLFSAFSSPDPMEQLESLMRLQNEYLAKAIL